MRTVAGRPTTYACASPPTNLQRKGDIQNFEMRKSECPLFLATLFLREYDPRDAALADSQKHATAARHLELRILHGLPIQPYAPLGDQTARLAVRLGEASLGD